MNEIKLTHTAPAQGLVPDNARGACSSRNYWMLREPDRNKYALGWWDQYDKKPARSRDFAYLLGRKECEAAHSFGQVVQR